MSLKLCCVCCGRAGGNGRHSLDVFALKTSPSPSPSPSFLLLIYIYILLLPPSGGTLDPYLLLEVSLPLKICKNGSWLSPKSRKNVKRKHYFCKIGAPLSHLRLARLDFFLLRFSNVRSKTYHSVRGCP